MKNLFFLLQLFLFIAFNFFLLIAIYQIVESSSATKYPNKNDDPLFSHKEEFDPALMRLNSLEKVGAYCDSIYAEISYNQNVNFKETYVQIVSDVIRERFYHGYSLYETSNNFFAVLFSKISIGGLRAIVIPSDILKYPYAACSQQSIVMMEILKRRGLDTRTVIFSGKKDGHFCFEVYYNGGWHFIDTDMEPDVNVLKAYNRPSIAFLVRHQDILLKAYSNQKPEMVLDIFPNYSYGRANVFAAPHALIFQKLTKFFSYTIWVFFLITFIIVRKKRLNLTRHYVRNSRIHIPRSQSGKSSVYYPNYSA